MIPVTLYFVSRTDGAILYFETCYNYNVSYDYINQTKSNFTISNKYIPNKADFVIVKNGYQNNLTSNRFKPFYAGLVDSYDNSNEVEGLLNISTLHIINVFNFDFTSVSDWSGKTYIPSFEQHLINITSRWFWTYSDDNLTSQINLGALTTSTDFSYYPNDPPAVTNFIQYIINGFKKYNVVFEMAYVEVKSNNAMMFYFTSERKEEKIQLKNNIATFINWSIYVKESSIFEYNKLQIVDIATVSTFDPIIVGSYYVDKDGTLTTTLTPNVLVPTKCKVIVVDPLDENFPGTLAIAQSELEAIPYSHEITFQIPYENDFLNVNDIYIGLLCDIYYNQVLYKSVLTGYSVDSKTELISLIFGNIRTTMKYIVDHLRFV